MPNQQMQRQVLQRSIHQQHDRVLQQSENYNFPPNQQPQVPTQHIQIIKQQQQADWDMMQTRPNSQMQMRPDSQMQMRPDSQMQMHGQQQNYHQSQPPQQQFYPDQAPPFTDPRNASNQSFPNRSQMQISQPAPMQRPSNQMVYKQEQVHFASTSNSQFATDGGQPQFISNQQQQSGMYVQQVSVNKSP
jgi:hypothetical protein